MACSGKCYITIRFGGRQIKTSAIVTPAIKNEILVGLGDLKGLHVVHQQIPKFPEQMRRVQVDADVDKLIKEYSDVFSDTLKDTPMAGPPMHIYLKEGTTPTRVLTARQYPIHMALAAKEAIRELKKTVLKEVHEPTEWIAPGFFVLKGDVAEKRAMKEGLTVIAVKDLRLVVDYTGLNKGVMRPVHTFPSFFFSRRPFRDE